MRRQKKKWVPLSQGKKPSTLHWNTSHYRDYSVFKAVCVCSSVSTGNTSNLTATICSNIDGTRQQKCLSMW